METQVRTPQMVFMQPQRLIVPLFQRPYVWNAENQWEPLWNDVVRVTERLLRNPQQKQQPHFLGAVVLQQAQNPIGLMQQRTIIDGQQRLTTLQLLMDSLHAELLAVGATQSAMRLEPLVENALPFRTSEEDRFKVWPTNRDRQAFNAVMAAEVGDRSAVAAHQKERIAQAYSYFSEQARQWLASDEAQRGSRAAAIETVVRDYLQIVVIDLAAEENAQEIFETLNARGAQLTAADLIKNFIFQRLSENGADVEGAYEKYWKDFETGFWETEVSVGRLRYPRSSIFLNHWLIARTGEEVVAREVFDRYKRFADYDAGVEMMALLPQVHAAAGVYRAFTTDPARLPGPAERLSLFGYRTSVLESEVIKPLILALLDPEKVPVPDAQLSKVLDVVESWMVRRMLVRAGTKNYTEVIAELISRIRQSERSVAGDVAENLFAGQTSAGKYWPDDSEVREELNSLQAYTRLRQSRLRMVLEAVEDHLRGWRDGKSGLGGQRAARSIYAIEHIMPRSWEKHWPLAEGTNELTREKLIHTFGNLTLLTTRLNSKVSNGPWLGAGGKREALEGHDILLLNRDLLKNSADAWSEREIRSRRSAIAEAIIQIWPAPPGHRSGVGKEKVKSTYVSLADLLNAGVLSPGMQLFPRAGKSASYGDRVVTLLPDGRIDVEGTAYGSPFEAATAIVGHRKNGWSFFLVDPVTRKSIRRVREEYQEAMSVEMDDDDEGDDDDVS